MSPRPFSSSPRPLAQLDASRSSLELSLSSLSFLVEAKETSSVETLWNEASAENERTELPSRTVEEELETGESLRKDERI